MSSEIPALQVAALSFAYDSRPVLTDISLAVHRAEMLALVGPNGSGKTTVLRLLTGTLRPQSGTISVEGRPLSSLSRGEVARRIAVVPQKFDPALLFTGYQMVAMGRAPYLSWFQSPSVTDETYIKDALEQTDAAHLAGRPFSQMSGGEQQRIAVAMALAQDTPILLLDEPTQHLDLEHQYGLLEILLRLRRERGLSILAVMHDLNLSSLYFDRLAVLNGGRVVAAGPPGQVVVDEGVLSVLSAPVYMVPHPQTGAPQLLLKRGE